ncbi:protein hunchback [Culicoides brevitarsis]|uniref:protein hunchback n=1 Tax=Culicoides brevitarsis TaxID=469753 RepID=UPI00307C3A9E
MWDTTMMTSTATSYENFYNMPIKQELPESETESPNTHFDSKMFMEATGNALAAHHAFHPLGFNPLTPPGYPNILLPTQRNAQNDRPTTPLSTYPGVSSSLTPTHTPPIDVTPPKSPKNDFTPEKDDSECGESFDDNHSIVSSDNADLDSKVPKVNSHGKVKTHKCKQCGFVAVTKLSFWEHTKSHIKPEKMLTCPKCPFVTEYKHHLEYHLRNHQRSKPFQCPSCNYSCVNKSMLNSHLKSHSAVFQYRCADCNYATKYCHSLKLHLRKYTHKPDVVLNQDGTPNPLPIIDVYGTRRGPKTKANQTKADLEVLNVAKRMKIEENHEETTPKSAPKPEMMPSMLPSALANMFQSQNPSLFPYLNLNLQMLAAQQQAMASQLSPNFPQSPKNVAESDDFALNLTQNKTPTKNDEAPTASQDLHVTPVGKNRRKGRAFKLPSIIPKADHEMERPSSASSNENEPQSPVTRTETPESQVQSTSVDPKKSFECKFCDISFRDDVLYTIHMGYHGYNDVFKCNMCGEKCDDRVSFFLHIARSSHT